MISIASGSESAQNDHFLRRRNLLYFQAYLFWRSTGENYVHDSISNGADIDGVLARYLSDD